MVSLRSPRSGRTIESTIRLKDGETNFLAGLIQEVNRNSDTQTPFLSDIPFLGRLFTQSHKSTQRTDLVMTDDAAHRAHPGHHRRRRSAPMWVGTQNNLSFRGLSPKIESRTNNDPFTARDAGSATQFGPATVAAPLTTGPATTTTNGAVSPNGNVPMGTAPVWNAPNAPGPRRIRTTPTTHRRRRRPCP